MERDFQTLPANLPVPEDDGGADHLTGMQLPELSLDLAGGGELEPERLGQGKVVVFIYPRTGTPGLPLIEGWDQIPGARGCTPQSCAYRDRIADFGRMGVTVFGMSSQPVSEQAAFQEREGIPYPLINDSGFRLGAALSLPTFEAEGTKLYRRLTFVAVEGLITKVFYPVFPPDRNAGEVLSWLELNLDPDSRAD